MEDPRIKEIGFGEYEGVSCNGEDPVSRAFRLFFNAPGEYIAPKGAETIEELYERTGDFLKELCEKEEWQQKNILISTHGAAMTALLNRIRGSLSVESFWQEKVPPNCSVTTVQIENGVPCIVRENEIFYKEKSDSGILYDGRSSPVYLRVRKAGLLLLPCNPTVAVLFCICSLKQQFIAA